MPAGVGEGVKGQRWSKGEVQARIRKSLKAEHPGIKGTKAQREASRWAGADKRIAAKTKPKVKP